MTPSFQNRVRQLRELRGWSQAELAACTGVSRTGISAIEAGRLVPSTATALALAETLQCRVEEIFSLGPAPDQALAWAIEPRHQPARFWQANVNQRWLAYPRELVAESPLWHDGVYRDGNFSSVAPDRGLQTLVVACCDPASGLLAAEYARQTPYRLLVVRRSSREALRMLGQGLVHAAGVHLGRAGEHGNAAACLQELGTPCTLTRVARWQEGLAVAPGVKTRSIGGVVRSRLRWIGREVGSGARLCLDELLGNPSRLRRIAHDHRGVATAIRDDWADVGVCVRLTSEEFGLEFLPVREEDYDLCIPAALLHEPRVEALIRVMRSAEYRQRLGELPGYDSNLTGEQQSCR